VLGSVSSAADEEGAYGTICLDRSVWLFLYVDWKV